MKSESDEQLKTKKKLTKRAISSDDLAGSLKGLGALLRPNTKQITFMLMLLMILTGVSLVPEMLGKFLIDEVLNGRKIVFLWFVIGGYIVYFGLRNILYFYSKFAAVNVGEHVAFSLRKQLFEQLQRKNLRYYRKHSPGKVSSRVMNDSFMIQSFIQDDLPTLLQSLLLFLALIAVLYAINWKLAIVATAVLPLHVLAATWFKRPIKAASSEAQEHLADAQSSLIEKLFAAEVVKGFTGESRENLAFAKAIDRTRKSQIRSKKFHVRQKVVGDLLIGLGTISLIGFGAYQVYGNVMTTGVFVMYFGYVLKLYPNVMELMSGFAKLTRVSASIDRVFEVLDSQESETDVVSPIKKPIRGDIAFRDVAVSFDDREPLINSFHLEIESGTVCAFTGPSGSGKSTLAKLLLRFVDTTKGMLTIDGVDIKDYDLQHLRESVGIAFQDCLLFESTILENLHYANPEATIDEIIDVAKKTGAHEIISALPHGYGTDIGGNDGISLSRGEMQRIALARAMLKNPRILILDEATSSVDSDSEAAIIPAVLKAMKGRTVIMITSNRELLSHADMVAELADKAVNIYNKQQVNERYGDGVAGRIGKSMNTMMNWAIATILIGVMSFNANTIYAQEAKPASKPVPAVKAVEQKKADLKPAPVAKPAEKKTAPSAAKPVPARPVSKPVIDKKRVANATPKSVKIDHKPKAVVSSQSKSKKIYKGIGDFFPMSGVNKLELDELIDIATSNAKSQKGYVVASDWLSQTLPAAPSGLNDEIVLAREEKDGVHLLHVGYKTYRSQAPHVYIYAQTLGSIPDIAKKERDDFVKSIRDAKQKLDDNTKNLKVRDLASELITLSYIDADRAVALLKGFGFQCIDFKIESLGNATKYRKITPSGSVDVKKLPAIVLTPTPDFVDLVGGTKSGPASFGMTQAPTTASELKNYTNAARTMDLLVLYNPAKPEQFSDVLDRIRNTIDLPAQQIYIEAMVLEISETGLQKLGVQWTVDGDAFGGELERIQEVIFGRLPNFQAANDESKMLDISVEGLNGKWRAQLQALVRDGNAEILSRPSVLTLDTRQASIRVGEELPVATSYKGSSTSEVVLNFKYIPVGILLNVRPRVASNAEEVSMQIDGIVSNEVVGEELVIRDRDQNVLAQAPRISVRRVQTHTRIANNTPFIIGGLVSRDQNSQIDKVPFLGDIPLIGNLFRSTDKQKKRREVIIVITPYILPNNRVVGRNLPKDEDAFDSFDHQLFRDAYRIRAEDVFDLGFLLKNEKLQEYKRLANMAVERDFRLAASYPFDRFVGERFPGEPILVYRQMYEVIKRLKLDEKINEERIIFFEPDEDAIAEFDVSFLWTYAKDFADEVYADSDDKPKKDTDLIFDALKERVIAITYTLQPDGAVDDILNQPVPDIRILDCPDRHTWDELLWKMNQVNEEGKQQYTILIQNQKDLARLKRAILLKQVVRLNGGHDMLTLSKFAIGRQLLMPGIKTDKVYLIDEEAAKYFFFTEQYYPALKKELMRDLRALRAALQVPNVSRYLDVPLPSINQSLPVIDLAPNIED
ncbi:ABC transporter transmembrane domain-containing protein [Poriferisphaera corsica]|nr:ABC transporter transmembrane domain-containing protein [Poriferisphaera corsica]